jgi:hypothetical protein
MDFNEIKCEGVDYITLTLHMQQWQGPAYRVMNLCALYKAKLSYQLLKHDYMMMTMMLYSLDQFSYTLLGHGPLTAWIFLGRSPKY